MLMNCRRVSKIDPNKYYTVYRTVKLLEESGILTKHEFKGGKARYEELNEGHHDHLIDVKTGEIIGCEQWNEILQRKFLKNMVIDWSILTWTYGQLNSKMKRYYKNIWLSNEWIRFNKVIL